MNDIPAPKAVTVSVYLADGGVDVNVVDVPVSDVTILPEGAILWLDPVGHLKVGEDALQRLFEKFAQRPVADPWTTTGAAS